MLQLRPGLGWSFGWEGVGAFCYLGVSATWGIGNYGQARSVLLGADTYTGFSDRRCIKVMALDLITSPVFSAQDLTYGMVYKEPAEDTNC